MYTRPNLALVHADGATTKHRGQCTSAPTHTEDSPEPSEGAFIRRRLHIKAENLFVILIGCRSRSGLPIGQRFRASIGSFFKREAASFHALAKHDPNLAVSRVRSRKTQKRVRFFVDNFLLFFFSPRDSLRDSGARWSSAAAKFPPPSRLQGQYCERSIDSSANKFLIPTLRRDPNIYFYRFT